MNAIKNITVGHTERLRKPVGYTMLANLVNIVPFCLSIEAINVIFRTFDGSGTPLDTNRLWMIFAILVVYMVVMAFAEPRGNRVVIQDVMYDSEDVKRVALWGVMKYLDAVEIYCRVLPSGKVDEHR